ncbi:hypothetical protein [Campylobacter sp. RM16192]|uniref:hypothetical protein n=1 Tax=Campylobacter sp. RM16192 TaxID=1660080 RepID=UPI001451C82C|nr:hypothetical protein [Campylobacter sp. RM16192]QCD52838.1 hypothetical protein CDOMC_1231 [Campylobacter sp. RM16192]
MKKSIAQIAEEFSLPVDCVLYHAKWALRAQNITKKSFLNENEYTDIKNELLGAGKRRKELYFLIEKALETRVFANGKYGKKGTLTEHRENILALRYGYKCKPHPFKDIAQMYGRSAQRVVQVDHSTITMLKHPKIKRELQEQFDFKSYVPKLNFGPESIALINFYNKHKEESDV